MGSYWTSIAGIVIIVLTLREMFRDLFQPSQSGALSSILGRRIFRLGRRARWILPLAGPLTVVIVISCWAILIAIGFALIYWARFPQAFEAVRPEPHDPLGRFWAVLYFSLASLTTLASGQLSPRGSWIRIVTALESLIGISLLTASVTWIILIYPALGRMRSLARRISVLFRAQKETGMDVVAQSGESLLGDLSLNVIRARIDFIHFPLIYYFHTDTEGASLAVSLQQTLHLAELGSHSNRPEHVRLAAATLKIALSDLAEVFADKYVRSADANDPEEVFRAVAEDHHEKRT